MRDYATKIESGGEQIVLGLEMIGASGEDSVDFSLTLENYHGRTSSIQKVRVFIWISFFLFINF